MITRKKKRKTLGQEIVQDLKQLCESVERGEVLVVDVLSTTRSNDRHGCKIHDSHGEGG